MVYFFAAVTVGLAVTLIIAIISGYQMAAAGFVEGKRAAFKEVIDYCRARQDVAVYMAPQNELTMSLVRARAIHDVEMEMRQQLALTPVRS